MQCVILLALLGCAMTAARVLPQGNQMVYLQQAPLSGLRDRRAPLQQAMLVTGYYGHPINRRSGYAPESAMSAFASGDAVSTGSYLGRPCASCPEYVALASNPQPEFIEQGGYGFQVPSQAQADTSPTAALPADAESTAIADAEQDDAPAVAPLGPDAAASDDQEELAVPAPPARKPKDKKERKPVVLVEEEEDAEDDDDAPSWPFQPDSRRQQGPGYNSFFPIMFSGYPGAGFRGGDSGAQPGVATAIANSFSTGKGGSATSHAIAYGGPSPRSKKRNSEEA